MEETKKEVVKESLVKEIEVGGETIYLKRRLFGYKIVHPIKNKDGSINIVNLLFGGWSNLVKTLLYIGLAVLVYFGVQQMLGSCAEIAANPCAYCRPTF